MRVTGYLSRGSGATVTFDDGSVVELLHGSNFEMITDASQEQKVAIASYLDAMESQFDPEDLDPRIDDDSGSGAPSAPGNVPATGTPNTLLGYNALGVLGEQAPVFEWFDNFQPIVNYANGKFIGVWDRGVFRATEISPGVRVWQQVQTSTGWDNSGGGGTPFVPDPGWDTSNLDIIDKSFDPNNTTQQEIGNVLISVINSLKLINRFSS